MKRLILIIILLCLFQIQLADLLMTLGKQMSFLGNLPSRYLGVMYAATILQPTRRDYIKVYITEWAVANFQNRIKEGTSRPTVPFMAINMAKQNPEDRDFRILAELCSKIEKDRKEELKSKEEAKK